MEHNGQALNVIIDNGSGMNVISEMAIERLGLKIENHPTSYRISWVNNVIIDNGSGMNVISEMVIERLGLKIENHPTSYRISWVNEANSVLVKQWCLVKFSLGKKIYG